MSRVPPRFPSPSPGLAFDIAGRVFTRIAERTIASAVFSPSGCQQSYSILSENREQRTEKIERWLMARECQARGCWSVRSSEHFARSSARCRESDHGGGALYYDPGRRGLRGEEGTDPAAKGGLVGGISLTSGQGHISSASCSLFFPRSLFSVLAKN